MNKWCFLFALLTLAVKANATKYSVIIEAVLDCDDQIAKVEKTFNKKHFDRVYKSRFCEFGMDLTDKELDEIFDNDRVLYISVYNENKN